MTQKETDKIFNRITSNGCREMCEIRFHQAVNEIFESRLTKCSNCGEMVKMISTGEMCPNCKC